jgi:hypothetical protein
MPESRRAAGRGVLLTALSVLSLLLFACQREKPVERIDLPPTPVLSVRSNWGVVRAPFLRLREQPLEKATILAHVRQGAVLEIISHTEEKETIEGESAYWYQVTYEGLRGWVFGVFLEVVETKAEAESLARDLH